ncbi:ibr finger domain protein [Diplodia corticola]|uniref:Ibr finger domain protein n=1 Tax=Diplodia corticola TaxID=236234 RepID=A0A1J9RTT9_9PEZI|nr:ibr finger domain protein [Diplodia corticola]OJD35979.1 ibr finger domain protein [Diplodia corticola]
MPTAAVAATRLRSPQKQTSGNSSDYLSLDAPTSWSWDAWDAGEDAKGAKREREEVNFIDDDDANDDDDEDLAWRLQLEALQDMGGAWDDGSDAEFALMRQVAEIEEAGMKGSRKNVGGEDGVDDEELALLLALEEAGGWWSAESNGEGMGMERSVKGAAAELGKDVVASPKVLLQSPSSSPPSAEQSKTPRHHPSQKSMVDPGRGCGSSSGNSSSHLATSSTRVGGLAATTDICVVCNDPSPQDATHLGLAVLPCNHAYCATCLNDLFRATINDPTLFPPRCCGLRVPLDSDGDVDDEEGENDGGRTQQPTTASKGRAGACYRRWLDAETVMAFERRMASVKGPVAMTAGTTEVDEEFLRMAEACGWARCCGCGRFVELEYGCNHMRCCCGAHFCYACGKPWKTCDCAQWDEERLLKRATDLVAPPPPAVGTAGREAAVVVAPADEDVVEDVVDDSNRRQQRQRPPQDTEPPEHHHISRHNTASPTRSLVQRQQRQQQQQRQRQRQQRTHPGQPPSAPRAAGSRPPPTHPHHPPPAPPPPPHHHNDDTNEGNNNTTTHDTIPPDDPPPPYPGPPLPPLSLDRYYPYPYPYYHNNIPSYHHIDADPARPRPLTRAEYARLRAAVRTVVDALNAVLAGMDGDVDGDGGGNGGGGSGGSAAMVPMPLLR